MAHTTQKNINGVLTDVTVFDASAQELDDAAAKSLWQSNPNLIDNWFFPNAVNQRGATSYEAAGYTIDRWSMTSAAYTVSVSTDGVTITADSAARYLTQTLENGAALAGKTVTFTALLAGGGLYTSTFTIPSTWAGGDVFNTLTFSGGAIRVSATSDGSSVMVQIRANAGASVTYAAVKLELGSGQTLVHQDSDGNWALNEIPDFGTQLARCQRYQFQMATKFSVIGSGVATSATAAYVVVPLPVTMRTVGSSTTPTYSGLYLIGSGHVGGSAIAVTAVAAAYLAENGVGLQVTASGLTAGAAVDLQLRGDDCYFRVDNNL